MEAVLMFRMAAWVVDQEVKAMEWMGIDFKGKPEAAIWFGLISAPYLVAIGMQPYHGIYNLHAGMSWAVKDIAWSKEVARTGALGGKYNTYTLYNYAPKMLKFGKRGGLRLVALKVGARFIPYVGWALLAYDAYSVGKWAHGKLTD